MQRAPRIYIPPICSFDAECVPLERDLSTTLVAHLVERGLECIEEIVCSVFDTCLGLDRRRCELPKTDGAVLRARRERERLTVRVNGVGEAQTANPVVVSWQ